MRVKLLAGVLLVSAGCATARTVSYEPATRVGPERGTLMIVGGGQLGPDITGRFIELAGGADRARIVVIPTAGENDAYPQDWSGTAMFRRAGVQNITILHTRDRDEANAETFTNAIRNATGVWISGGRQWRLVDSYLETRTQRELFALLDRGGVIGGTSAGASIQGSYMVRGAREGNTIMMAPGYEKGFGLVRGTAVDQHLLARNRQNDMLDVIERHPALLGIGIDEGTAIVVRADTAEVIGRSKVAFYNTDTNDRRRYFFLERGARFDLGARKVLTGEILPSSAHE